MKSIFRVFNAVVLLAGTAAYGGTLAQFRTIFGDVEVELFDQQKPITVDNFKRYVQAGLYQNMFFHRWHLEPTLKVIQGGGFYALSTNIYSIPTFPAITNEALVAPLLSNTYGTISMARTQDPNSASCQFFFNLQDDSFLDTQGGGYAVFGRTIGGTNVLNRFLPPTNGVYQLNKGGVFAELPATSTNVSSTNLESLIYVDVTLLNVHVRNVAAGREISWNSATNLVNHVEYTTTMPPVWQTLLSTNGTGAQMTITNNARPEQFRFYRVTVSP